MTAPDSPRVDRRTALRAGGGALAIVLGVGAGWLDRRGGGGDAASPTATTTTTVATSGEFPDVGEVDPGILVVGTRYLATHPDENDLATLLAALPPVDDDPVTAAAARLRDDFARGETVVVDGWVLARSEARAAAILALACGTAAC